MRDSDLRPYVGKRVIARFGGASAIGVLTDNGDGTYKLVHAATEPTPDGMIAGFSGAIRPSQVEAIDQYGR